MIITTAADIILEVEIDSKDRKVLTMIVVVIDVIGHLMLKRNIRIEEDTLRIEPGLQDTKGDQLILLFYIFLQIFIVYSKVALSLDCCFRIF